jgi:protein-S-isoprenylcysteine O-methyltransferase Ste14
MPRFRVLVKALLFTLTLPLLVAIVVPYFLVRPLSVSHRPVNVLPGVLMISVGFAIYCCCVWNFADQGKGTPAPIDPPKAVVAEGLYRYSRNPMYVGVLTFIFGEAVLLARWQVAVHGLIVAVCFHCFVVFYEEPALRKKFGSSYEDYCRTVRRWL